MPKKNGILLFRAGPKTRKAELMDKQDYSHQMTRHASLGVRLLLVFLGTVFVVIGVIGIFLPLLPTTPFMLLAAACYAKSSSRFYNWIMNNRIFGPIIREWREHRSIPRRAKMLGMILLVLTFGTSIIFFVPIFYVQVALTFMCAGMLFFMWRIPVRDLQKD